MELEERKELDRFLTAIEQALKGITVKNEWPLNAFQLNAYFESIESIDIFNRFNVLKKQGKSIKEIAELFPDPAQIRTFMGSGNCIIGLKVAKKWYKIGNVSIEERVRYVLDLFKVMKAKQAGDIFCLDGTNRMLNEKQVDELVKSTKWEEPKSKAEQKEISSLIIHGENLCYTLYYDVMDTYGFIISGPYDVAKYFGPSTVLLIRDYVDMRPELIWPEIKNWKYKKMKLLLVYKNPDITVDFYNQPHSTTSIGDKLIKFFITVDDKPVSAKDTEKIYEDLMKYAKTQSMFVRKLPDLDKVRQGAKISYYPFKKLRDYFGDDWRPPKEIEENIANFGDKFIEEGKHWHTKPPPAGHWRNLFDPRNDYFEIEYSTT